MIDWILIDWHWLMILIAIATTPSTRSSIGR
ncbi:Uncharacterised protein [Mycobacteroides abscessus subsp. abscessus]|nr:hypothetical protein [Mycobacteroides abscessus]SLC98015.1 Uncharacterised protein [Mycobacteroides abscessus subsp. abscessus]SLF98646.1 Uncharacterised protein [Mycobacteroides abscessus subsp. abscessus]SLK33655.1 Uncharacterised protein [Mycobacteroides abscessus subsp. abscessus]